jgi:tetraacyldisaccharide 4'-kinase
LAGQLVQLHWSRRFSAWLQGQWYRLTPWQLLLRPIGEAFGFVVWVRRALYHGSLLRSVRLPVPVIVVGNIDVGGSGKTPLTIWLVDFLREMGFKPGVVSRGYARSSAQLLAAKPDSDPAEVGDEPLLIARRTGVPVFVAADRVAAAQTLLRSYPDCNVIVSDDGLQHYRLRRDLEIVVVDGERRLGNGNLLPAGPLRESKERLHFIDAIVVNGGREGRSLRAVIGVDFEGMMFHMGLRGEVFYNLKNPELRARAEAFSGQRLYAIAGIANPERFFRKLRSLGVKSTERAFPDHHAFVASDLDFAAGATVLMTEKDAVKCQAFARENWWALAVSADLSATFGYLIVDKVKKFHGPQTA